MLGNMKKNFEPLVLKIWRFCAYYSQKSLPVIKRTIHRIGAVEIAAIPVYSSVGSKSSEVKDENILISKKIPGSQSRVW